MLPLGGLEDLGILDIVVPAQSTIIILVLLDSQRLFIGLVIRGGLIEVATAAGRVGLL